MHLKRIYAACLLLCFTSPALADEDLREMLNALSVQVAALKDQLQQSNTRINELEGNLERADKRVLQPAARLAVISEAKPAVTLGDAKDTFKIPGSNTSLGFGGFTKLDVIHNSVGARKADGLGNQVFLASQIPVGSGSDDRRQGEVVLHAKESRIWFKSFTPNEFGDVTTHFEFDVLGAGGSSYTPRSRHAYGSIGHLLGGQTWTTFLNVKAIPETMDNIGSVGMLSPMRQPMVRWSQGIDGTGLEWQIAAEAPAGRLITSGSGDVLGYTNMSPVPDIVARLNYTSKSASISLATMARKIQNDGNPLIPKVQSAWGGAVSASGKIDFFQNDNLMFMASYGNALGRYTSGDVFEDAALDSATGNMELVDVYSMMLSYQHAWNKNWRSTAVFGVEHADQPEFVSQLMTKQAESIHLNLLWSPVAKSTIGIEFIHGARELVSGKSGALNRVQFSTRFNF